MKLITEQNFDIQYLTEANEGKKNYFIEGVFMQGDIQNRNGRMYPSSVLVKEMNRYNAEFVQKNRAYGELGHPDGPTINLERVSHMIKSLKQEGSDIIGKAKIMTETPMGNIVKNLMDEGAQLGVSSRGMGSLKSSRSGIMEVQDDFMLATAGDIVADPSAPSAFVRGIMEGVEWVRDAASGSWRAEQVIDQTEALGRKSAKQLEEQKFAAFKAFLDHIARG